MEKTSYLYLYLRDVNSRGVEEHRWLKRCTRMISNFIELDKSSTVYETVLLYLSSGNNSSIAWSYS